MSGCRFSLQTLTTWVFALAACAAVFEPAAATASDRPVTGARLDLSLPTDSAPGWMRFSAVDSQIDPGLFVPAAGAALLVGSSARAGACRVEVAFDSERWWRLGLGERTFGWIHLGSVDGGVLLALIHAGGLHVVGSGSAAPCPANASDPPSSFPVEFRTGDDRYCADFGEVLARDAAGDFHGRDAPPPSACPDSDLSVANLNVLHGIGCADAAQCRMPERIALLFDWIEAAGCPDVVTLQEVAELEDFVPVSVREAIVEQVAERCPFDYEIFFEPFSGFDEELILSRHPILDSEVLQIHLALPAPGRHVTWVRVDHPIGPVDVFTTHLSSGADLANRPCDNAFADCPTECVEAGAGTARRCQAVQMARFVEARHDVDTPAVITGDFNAVPGSFELGQLTDRGWIDTHLAAGNPECDPDSGANCTSGRASDLEELDSPASNVDQRIDYIFLVPPGPGSVCRAALDSPDDGDADGIGTRLFADAPNPFAPECGPDPLPTCWPSDHQGNELDLQCAGADAG